MDAAAGGLIFTIVSIVVTVATMCGSGVVAMAAMALPAWILWKVMQQGDATRKLLAEGEPATAKVLELHQTGMMINNNPQVRMVVDVTRDGGEPYRAQIVQVVDFLAIPRVQPGCALKVRVDRGDPQKMAVEGYAPVASSQC
jgi:hypothetical protein